MGKLLGTACSYLDISKSAAWTITIDYLHVGASSALGHQSHISWGDSLAHFSYALWGPNHMRVNLAVWKGHRLVPMLRRPGVLV